MSNEPIASDQDQASDPRAVELSPPRDHQLPQAQQVHNREGISAIWIIPIIALIVGGTLAYRAVMNRGPTVTVTFDAANGLEAKKTKIKYKDVVIGRVKSVVLTRDLSRVKVKLQIDRRAETLISSTTRFWIVRPRVRGMSISGLETLLSGTYVALDPGDGGTPQEKFVGLDTPPIVTHEADGELFTLEAETLGSLDYNSPVYYRDITVGRVVAYRLLDDGRGVEVKVFVDSPHHTYVTKNTRFWSAFGIDVEMNTDGVRVNSKSLASLMVGGISFMSPKQRQEELPPPTLSVKGERPESAPTATPIQRRTQQRDLTFTLYSDEKSAMREEVTDSYSYLLRFKETLRGLSVGDPVEFKGFPVGQVSSISVSFDETTQDLLTLVMISVEGARLDKVISGFDLLELKSLLNTLVKSGLRAQVLSDSLITGKRFVMLDFFKDDTPKSATLVSDNLFEIPTYPSPINELTTGAKRLLKRAQEIPFESVAWETTRLLKDLRNISDIVRDIVLSDEVGQILRHTETGLANFSALLARDSRLVVMLQRTLRQLRNTAKSLHNFTDQIERHPEWLLRGK